MNTLMLHSSRHKWQFLVYGRAILLAMLIPSVRSECDGSEISPTVRSLVQSHCLSCHRKEDPEAGFDLETLTGRLDESAIRNRWIQVHDRIRAGEMPPAPKQLPQVERDRLLTDLEKSLHEADQSEIERNGRGPLRRLTREEYEQNLRDLLELPDLDLRDMLPPDRIAFGMNRTATALDISRIQLMAYLDAADVALRLARANSSTPPSTTRFRAEGTRLFSATSTFGEREAMFFAKDGVAVDPKQTASEQADSALELALFRSAHWPYFGYPKDFVAKQAGTYRVRFSARAVVQLDGYRLQPARLPQPMTFRARRRSGPDVSGDVRATGGLIDIKPTVAEYETTVRLRAGETIEYSLLGLPVPLARNVDGGPPTYRYPPFPKGGQPGAAFQWLEIEGPVSSDSWPPPSHEVLFADLGFPLPEDASPELIRQLMRRFLERAARQPMNDQVLERFVRLVEDRIRDGVPFKDAMLTGYSAFLSSAHFLFLADPSDPATSGTDQFSIASRLSHFLTNTRPDADLMTLASSGRLRDRSVLETQVNRLISAPEFNRFVQSFTDYWLDLRKIRRDEPDIRLFPEYRFDNYLVQSMERETRMFVREMIRRNRPIRVMVDADSAYINDRLSRHYNLEPVSGSSLVEVELPKDSPFGGLITQATLMKVTANGTSTSPVLRGAWIMDRLLGDPIPPPPTSVPAVEPDIRGAKSIRELLARHAESEQCADCHDRFDHIGFALENFDVLGAWRTHYRSTETGTLVDGIDRAGHDFAYHVAEAIDAAGTMPDGRSFQSIMELKQILSRKSRQLARGFLSRLILYATGTPVRFADRREVERLLDQCAPGNFRTRDLIHALVQSRIFLGMEPPE